MAREMTRLPLLPQPRNLTRRPPFGFVPSTHGRWASAIQLQTDQRTVRSHPRGAGRPGRPNPEMCGCPRPHLPLEYSSKVELWLRRDAGEKWQGRSSSAAARTRDLSVKLRSTRCRRGERRRCAPLEGALAARTLFRTPSSSFVTVFGRARETATCTCCRNYVCDRGFFC